MLFFPHRDKTTLTFVVLEDKSTDSVDNLHKEKTFISGDETVMATTFDAISGAPTTGVSTISGHSVTRIYNNVTTEPPPPQADQSSWTDSAAGPAIIASMAFGGVALLAGMALVAAKLLNSCRSPPLG